MSIPGLGSKTLALLHKKFHITSLDELKACLEKAAKVKLPAFGQKKIENLKRGIELWAGSRQRIVVASIHSSFKHSKEETTERLLKALGNPHVDILGHPTGRLTGSREPLELDWYRVHGVRLLPVDQEWINSLSAKPWPSKAIRCWACGVSGCSRH